VIDNETAGYNEIMSFWGWTFVIIGILFFAVRGFKRKRSVDPSIPKITAESEECYRRCSLMLRDAIDSEDLEQIHMAIKETELRTQQLTRAATPQSEREIECNAVLARAKQILREKESDGAGSTG
jgi:hypothetical protein